MPDPKAVLLDVGGVFHLPNSEVVLGAFERGGFTANPDDLARAHYTGAAAFTCDFRGDDDWGVFWKRYLDGYARACGVPDDIAPDVHAHLDSEFAVGALWTRIIDGSVEGLRALVATGVRVGIVSNADGSVAARLAEQEVLQVGPGLGVEVECVIDSGVVGVSKPDPRIFHIALEALGVEPGDAWYVGDMPGIDVNGARAAGLRPFVMDPFDLQPDADYERVGSLDDVAERARLARRSRNDASAASTTTAP